MASDESTANPEDAATPPRDASLRVDPRSLSNEEQDFAKMMGFGDDGNAPAAVSPDPVAAPASPAPPVVSFAEPAAERPAVEIASAVANETVAEESTTASDPLVELPVREWDEIHPRAAKLGRQAKLLEQVERILTLEEFEVPAPAVPITAPDTDPGAGMDSTPGLPAGGDGKTPTVLGAEATARASTPHGAPQDALRALEKRLEATRSDLDTALLERDRLDDALAIANVARNESALRVERLETALRAARGPGGTLPEGESALRAEVQGLRRRLEDAQCEVRTLRESLANHATDLAIALAHRDDRQQELDQRREELERLERERAAENERLDDALIRQRELLALVSRVQAENVELRSTQSALEETLEARDLEIEAREEHLQVTRRGLAARDTQLRDAEDRLEQERHRRELVEAELERARQAAAALDARVARREARIAALASTLTRVEEAIGHPSRALPTGEPPLRAPRTATADIAEPEVPALPPSISFVSGTRPQILRRWRDAQIRALTDDADRSSLAEWFAAALSSPTLTSATARASGPDGPAPNAGRGLRLISLAGAEATIEIELVRALEARGGARPQLRLIAPTPEQASLLRTAIEGAGLLEVIEVEMFGGEIPAADADAILLCDTLWDQPDPEALLRQAAAALSDGGCLLFADRLAGGPLTLSEATCTKLAELWQVLPERWTALPGFGQAPEAEDDAGVPAREFDLPALLSARFTAVDALGLGHVADLFLGPTRSPAFCEGDPIGENLLDSIRAIDEGRTLLESLAPRHGIAVLRRRAPENDAPSDDGRPAAAIVWSTVSRA